MIDISKYIIILFLLFAHASHGQISPGELSQKHAHLEGMSNCTKCHDLGKKVSSEKCLDCHKEIQSLIDNKKGYHANSSVLAKNCFDCHSEHFGRNFDLVRFDKESFDHKETGYALEGKHKVVDCGNCHKPDNITDPEIKKRPNTFLGLNSECLSCHDDFHQKTLSGECLSCHTMETFRPASKFDHKQSDFQLLGSHSSVDCKECHKTSTRNGVAFQQFTNISFGDCNSCHSDPHNQQIKGECSGCHNEISFSNFIGKGNFNHNTTRFSLKGSHLKIDCFSCHKKTTNPKLVFQDKLGTEEKNCVSCHADNHNGKFGKACTNCHNEKSFFSLNMKSFDHNITDYPLEGRHLQVNCKKCHPGRYSKVIDFSSCSNCHTDYHKGEFVKNNVSPDCSECHSLEHGFDYSLYTLEQHQETSFPLDGAHLATPCFACHVKKDRWTFKDLGTECIDCHEDLHDGYISKEYYPENECAKCHVSDSWSSITSFNHEQTNWPLEGKHAEINCGECHIIKAEDNSILIQAFNTLDSDCAKCHEDNHDDKFTIDGITDCKRCHVQKSWFPEKFDHDNTAFPLEGRHAEIDCMKCHLSVLDNGETLIIYKIEKFECIDCHL